jgi:hypothetical protein
MFPFLRWAMRRQGAPMVRRRPAIRPARAANASFASGAPVALALHLGVGAVRAQSAYLHSRVGTDSEDAAESSWRA